MIAIYDRQLRAMSPPCKLTPAIAVKLLSVIREGLHYEPACDLAGISYRTFLNWRDRGEDEAEDGPFAALMRAVKVAEAEAERETIGYVRAASRDPRFWAAGMTWAERRHPDRWKRRDDSQVTVNVGVTMGYERQLEPPTVTVQALSPAPETLTALSPVPGILVSD